MARLDTQGHESVRSPVARGLRAFPLASTPKGMRLTNESTFTRRRFLSALIQGAFLIGASSRHGAAAPLRSDISKKRGPPRRIVDVEGPPEKALAVLLEELGGIRQFVAPGAKVLIKPNMSFPNPPGMATTTDPRVLKAIILACLDAGASRIMVADHPMRPWELCAEKTGIRSACAGIKEVVLLGADQEQWYRRVALDRGVELKETKVLRALFESDVLINVPRMKSHSATTVSLGIKGAMGLIWERSSFHVRMDLNEAIADLATCVQADLTVLDGTSVLTDGGPLGPGTVTELRCLIGGVDPVAVDAYGVHKVAWYGRPFAASDIPHIEACHRRGLGEIDLDRMDIHRTKVQGL